MRTEHFQRQELLLKYIKHETDVIRLPTLSAMQQWKGNKEKISLPDKSTQVRNRPQLHD